MNKCQEITAKIGITEYDNFKAYICSLNKTENTVHILGDFFEKPYLLQFANELILEAFTIHFEKWTQTLLASQYRMAKTTITEIRECIRMAKEDTLNNLAKS